MRTDDCQCAKCREACERLPGRMSPDEAERAIAAGLASRLMLDWYDPCDTLGNGGIIPMISPGGGGHDGGLAPTTEDLFPDGFLQAFTRGANHMPCTFYRDGKCEIHASGFKPTQCRTVYACTGEGEENIDVARLWWTPRGRDVVEQWRRATGFNEEVPTW